MDEEAKKRRAQADEAAHKRDKPAAQPPSPSAGKREDDLKGLGQEGTAEPQPGIAENQGGGIEGAIGGGQSGQGGG